MRADALRNRAAILAAAQAVFTERGPSASTEEVAARAGVAVGTVFRHFATKADLLRALMKDLLQRLSDDVRDLADHGDAATGLFELFTRLVDEAAAEQTVVALLTATGPEFSVAQPLALLRTDVERLLVRGQEAGAIRDDVRIEEVMALLVSTCQGAVQAGWGEPLRRQVLTVVFDGLRPRPT